MNGPAHIPNTRRGFRLTEAKLAVKRAKHHADRYPAATGTPLVTELRQCLEGLIAELEA